MNAQTLLLNNYWLFLLKYFFPPRGGLGPKGCVGHTPMVNLILAISNKAAHFVYLVYLNGQ